MRPEGVVTFTPSLPFTRYSEPADRERFFAQLQERLGSQRGVTAVAAGLPMPMGGELFNGRWSRIEDIEDPTTYKQASYYAVFPGFFDAIGTRLMEGRDLTAAENADSASVVVVNRTMAEKAFPGESALGKPLHVRVSSQDPQVVQIVGVVEDQRMELTGPVREAVYFTPRFTGGGDVAWVVRSDLDLATATAVIRREVAAIDPLLPVEVEPLSRSVDAALAPTRFALALIAVFGAMALLMAAVGLYAVLAFTVRQRTAEIGVRMAFGAERATILKLVVGQGMALAAAGVAIGVVASLGLRNVRAGVIAGVEPSDPAAFVAAPLFFLAVAALACLIPAVRATRVDPLEALRAE
jgi:predicted permease